MNKHRIGALITAGVLTLTFAGTALGTDPVWATVDGHTDGDSAKNDPSYWGENCSKIDNLSIYTWEADDDYSLVVVKSASDAAVEAPNTIFEDVSKGETVWADTNANDVFDEGDKQISHIIVCEAVTTTTTSSTTSTVDTVTTTSTSDTSTTTSQTTTTSSIDTVTTGSVSESSESKEDKTPPQTDAIGSNGSGTPGGSLWALLVGAAGILAGVLLLTPRASRNRS